MVMFNTLSIIMYMHMYIFSCVLLLTVPTHITRFIVVVTGCNDAGDCCDTICRLLDAHFGQQCPGGLRTSRLAQYGLSKTHAHRLPHPVLR